VSDPEQFDIVYLGGGTGGYVSAIRAAQLGLKSAVIEKYKVGGTCLHWGCIPTKTLLQSAKVLDTVRHGGDFGVTIGDVQLDYGKVQSRKDRVVGQLYRGVEGLLRKAKATTIIGEGRITSATDVTVKTPEGERVVRGRNVVINTGSRPRALPNLPFDGEVVISSDEAVGLQTLPASIVIIGAGAIGVEFATFYRSVGVAVTLIELLPNLVPLEDAEVGAELEKLFIRQGMTVYSGAKGTDIQRRATGVTVTVQTREGESKTIEADKLLVAIGRVANTEALGLEGIGITLHRGFIPVNSHMATAVPGVYAIGDAAGGFLLAHKAMHEGIIAAEAIAGQSPEPLNQDRIPRCTYSHPQVASLGISEAEAKSRGHDVKIGKFPFSINSKALIEGATDGFVKIIGDTSTGEILGVSMIGPSVTELIDAPALAKLLESTTAELGLTIHAHPTLSEILGEAALASEGIAIHR